jgi:hypothetical protein
LRLLEDGIHHFQHEIDECLFASVQDQSIFKWKLIDPGLCQVTEIDFGTLGF